MGPCFDRYTIKKIPRATRMSAARQLLRALENLHNARIVHRDLNERNCMWGLSSIDHLTRSAKYEAVGRPQKESIPFVELWKPGELVIPLEFPDSLRTDQVYLGDFGLAKRLNDPETERGYPPPQYCSPERLHGKGPSFACDMWSYMTIFSLLYLGLVPFTNWPQGGVISGMVACLGPFPEDWKGSYVWGEACNSYYDQSEPADPNFTLSARITKMHPDCDEEERQHVLSVMNKVFNYDPDQRPTATELLHDPSFKAIMAKYGVDQGGPL
ncbi:kinase-like domain-containing protein, partial [Aspergillus stella-maris]|uniref:kinase-like domain-containing protein n=1 Tax=Aspergillus stella-maris TaxID=1810926 RepID=UPI003CCCB72F